MNSYVRRWNDDPLASRWIGWHRAKDRRLVIGSTVLVTVVYFAIWWNEEQERLRKHTSIEKDIERERWRAEELGLGKPKDDGFAEAYLQKLGSEDRLSVDHAQFRPENQKI